MKEILNNKENNLINKTVSLEDYQQLLEENRKLKEEIDNIQKQLDYLKEQLLLNRHKQFVTKADKPVGEEAEQLSLLFNEAEVYADEEEKEEEHTEVKAYTRKSHKKSSPIQVPPDAEVIRNEHYLSEDERKCPQCGSVMETIGSHTERHVEVLPPKIVVIEDIYYTYGCRNCEENGIHTPIVKAPEEPSIIPKSPATPEAVAFIATQKFVMGSPLYRQEQEYKRMGFGLSRQTMSNWLLRCADDWFEPIYDEMHRQLLTQDIIQADETEVQVLKEPDKKATSRSFMWLYRSAACSKEQIVIFEYKPDRRNENPKKFLEGFKGYLQTDGYAGYDSVEEATHVGCFAHLQRKFNDAEIAMPKGRRGTATDGVQYCKRLFHIEDSLKELSPEERYKERLEKEKPILDEMFKWAESKTIAPKSELGRAFTYMKNQWPHIVNYLKDGRLEFTNNRAERTIKPFVIARKNFLFSNTPRGAKGSAVIFSLIQSAIDNGLDAYKYLTYVLTKAPKLAAEDDKWYLQLLPYVVKKEDLPDITY